MPRVTDECFKLPSESTVGNIHILYATLRKPLRKVSVRACVRVCVRACVCGIALVCVLLCVCVGGGGGEAGAS